MKARNAIAAVALALVALLLALAGERATPGALASVHARERLDTPESCARCHGEGDGEHAMGAACSTCHAEIAAGIADGRGLHGQLDAALAQDCARCHGEHQGSDFQLVGAMSFTRAGFSGMDGYRHEGLEFGLRGAHDGLRCERCHELARVDVLPQGERRFLGRAQDCASCHEDPHKSEYGPDCASCHGQEQPFKDMDGMDHERYCPLVGAHAALACTACHQEGSEFSVAALARRHGAQGAGEASPEGKRDCLACHASPHAPTFLPRDVAAGASCALCHSAAHESFLGHHADANADWHAASGFALDAPHDGLRCESCHPGLGTRAPMQAGALGLSDDRAFRADFPGRSPDDCRSCHADPHAGQFATGPFAASRCVDCHDRRAFAPSHFGVEEHATTHFALEGAHAAAACTDCHALPEGETGATPDGRALRRFAGVSGACTACHESPHRASFVRDVAAQLGLADDEAACAQCHDARDQSFLGEHGDATRRLHAASGFALEPPHDKQACSACHPGFGVARAAGGNASPVAALPASLVAETPGRASSDCKACHADPHESQFQRGLFAGQGCIACHDPHTFRTPAFGEAHHARTRFPLTGGHLAVGCNACHEKAQGAARVFVDTPGSCAACHEDVHRGSFDLPGRPAEVDGATGCARCHTTEAFTDLSGERFDHALWTGYLLDGAHAKAACTACHVPRRTPDSDGRTFGKVPGTRCSDCHAPGTVPIDGNTERRR